MVGFRSAAAGGAHAQALLRQLKQLNNQHAQILEAYDAKLSKVLAEGPARAASGSLQGKRAGAELVALPEGPDAKRQRLLAERELVKKTIWDDVSKCLEKLRRRQQAEAFRQPVDPVKLNLPDYHTHIKKPMDLGTISHKLKTKQYSNPKEVAEDVRLVWQNCLRYNGAEHQVSKLAVMCSEFFEKEWGKANFEQRWIIASQDMEDDSLVNKLRHNRELLGTYMAAKDLKEGRQPGYLGPTEPERDMSFEEKRKLSAMLVSLPGEKLDRVLEILQQHQPLNNAADEEEVELDLDAVNNKCLWELKKYADSVLSQGSAPPKKTTPGNRAGPATKRPPAGPGGSSATLGGAKPAPQAAAAPVAAAGAPAAAAAAPAAPAAAAAGGSTPAAGQQQQEQYAAPAPRPPAEAGQQQQQQDDEGMGSPSHSIGDSHNVGSQRLEVQGSSAVPGFGGGGSHLPYNPSTAQSGVGDKKQQNNGASLAPDAAALQRDAWALEGDGAAGGGGEGDADDAWDKSAAAERREAERKAQEEAERKRMEELDRQLEADKAAREAQQREQAAAEVENMQKPHIQGDDVSALAALGNMARSTADNAAGGLQRADDEVTEMCLD